MNVVLIYGGKSGEHEISIISASSIAKNISREHELFLIGVAKNGKWYLQDNSVLSAVRSDAEKNLVLIEDEKNLVSITPGMGPKKTLCCNGSYIDCDVVFNIIHGTFGEDGTIQGLFEMAGIPYVGCDTLSSACTMDKETTKILWKNCGLPVVPYICITKSHVNDSRLYDKMIENAETTLGYPLFVKPCSAGSSDGANKANNRRELSYAIMEAFTWDNKVLVEKAINAREVECSVTGNSVTQDYNDEATVLKAYGPGEIIPKHAFYDYDAKYNDPNGAELKIPALLDEKTLEYIRETAKKAYSAVYASGLSRVDFFIDKDNDEIYLNEINTLPGFTNISMFPKMCQSECLEYPDLINLLLKEAIAQFEAKNLLCFTRIK